MEVEDSSNFFRTNVVQDYCVACQFVTRVLVLQQVVWSKNPQPRIHALPIYQSISVIVYIFPLNNKSKACNH